MRVGLVGYGLAGRYFHAPNLVAAGFDVAAICTRSLERRGIAHADFANATILSTVEELVEEDLDLVVIASVNDVHAEHALAAIRRGIPVVVDKPMGRDVYETESIFNEAERENVAVTVFFNRIWDSDTLTIKKFLHSNEFGEPIRFESRFERFRPQLTPGAWRESIDESLGGGLLLDLQTHLISTSIHLFGPCDLKFASVRSIRGGANDDVVLVLKHQSGVESYLSASAVSGALGPRIRLNFHDGSLIIRELDRQEDLLRKGYRPSENGWANPELVSSEAALQRGETSINVATLPGDYSAFYREVRRALETGSAMPITREFAMSVARIIDEAKRWY